MCVYIQLCTVPLLRPKGVERCGESHNCRTWIVMQYVEKKLKTYCPCTAVLCGIAASALCSGVEHLPTFQFVVSLTGFLHRVRCQCAHLQMLIKIKLV